MMCPQNSGRLSCCWAERLIRHTYENESLLSFNMTFLQPSANLIQRGGFHMTKHTALLAFHTLHAFSAGHRQVSSARQLPPWPLTYGQQYPEEPQSESIRPLRPARPSCVFVRTRRIVPSTRAPSTRAPGPSAPVFVRKAHCAEHARSEDARGRPGRARAHSAARRSRAAAASSARRRCTCGSTPVAAASSTQRRTCPGQAAASGCIHIGSAQPCARLSAAPRTP